ncbi:MAG: hypothetical protein IJC99_07020 [Clostridia bacterium]|nr:hypothetical protein [Clostridia bacterium]
MRKADKKQSYATVIAGGIILLAALLIILLSIFLPRIRENRIFKERYAMLESAEYERLLLTDPLFEGSGPITSRGVEVNLSTDEVQTLREALAAVRAGGIGNGENLAGSEGAWDTRLQIRTRAGERAELYFTEELMYFYADGSTFTFLPRDTVAYEALYHYLQTLLKAAA